MLAKCNETTDRFIATRNFLGKTMVFFAVLFLFACAPPQTPEEEIHDYISSGIETFENRRAKELRRYIAGDYKDSYGNSGNDLIRIAAGYFLRHQNIHLTTRIHGLVFSDKHTRAELNLDVAITPAPYAENDIRILRGEFHRLKLQLVKTDDWLLQSLVWQRITAEEFSGTQ